MEKKNYSSIDEYINSFPNDVKEKLNFLRSKISEAVPEATETISYNMPAFKTNKVLIYFAAYKDHIGIYPASKAIIKFKDDLKSYKTSKGTIQIPLDSEIPIELIKKIVLYNKNN